ncbi:MAG: bifunctional adenosylcobinamide kinase/adenosylcobinamide-phosphate guanylyltransferase [Leptolyngbya sp. SIO4C1]|nr:bifunctional adenosylcobinamide kinase/adenosylcobinamide-phosphate guanylyltransferase [Leptolyngbya sp. SIO4C1]
MSVTLITGPARSGKSEWAEQLALQTERPVVYVATSQVDPSDRDWQHRLAQHRARRPPSWQTLEVSHDLAAAIRQAAADQCLLVDSLGTWLANQLELDSASWQQTQAQLLAAIVQSPAALILVGEETGWGIVPAYRTGRLFRDRLGALVRAVGTVADAFYLVTGGYALNLKQLGTGIPKSSS